MSDKEIFVAIWTYLIKEEYLSEFEDGYNSNGTWAKFFQSSPDYIKTEFLKDIKNPLRRSTLDYWKSKKAYLDFYEKNNDEIKKIDDKHDAMTDEEILIGHFTRSNFKDK